MRQSSRSGMDRSMSFSLTALVAAGVLAAASGVAAALPPPVPVVRGANEPAERLDPNAKIAFETMNFDFGDIWDTDPVTTKFRFTNTGTAPMTVFSARGSCGCTAPNVVKGDRPFSFPVTFAPGETGDLMVRFDPTGRHGLQPKTVTLRTNDAANPSLTLNLTSNVKQIVLSDPGVVQFLNVSKHQRAMEEMTVWGVKDGFAIKGAESDNEFITVEIMETGRGSHPETKEDMGFSRVRFTLAEKAPIGRLNSAVSLMTNDDRRTEVVVRVIADIAGDLEASPNRIPLGRLTAGDSVEQTFRVKSKSGQPFKITGQSMTGRFSLTDGSVSITPVRPMRKAGEPEVPADAPATEYIVVMKGTAPDGQRMIRSDVLLSTDVVDEAEIKVPFFGSVRPTPD